MTGGKEIARGGAVARGDGRQPAGAAGQGGGRLSRIALSAAMAVVIAAAFCIVLGLEELTSRGATGLPALLDTRAGDGPGCTSFAIDRASGAAAAGPCHGEILALGRPHVGAGERF